MKRKSLTRKSLKRMKLVTTNLEGDLCKIARSLDVIGDGWSPLIVREAIEGSKRFGEFQRNLGLARNILAARLRALVEDGLLMKAPASEGSIRQEYLITKKGLTLMPVLVALAQWGHDHPLEKKAGVRALYRAKPKQSGDT
jgi:DNA-binding HxlR family transcriptional regulator